MKKAQRQCCFNGEPCLPGPALEDGDDDATLGFGLFARSLIADARFASGRDALRPLREWLTFVRGMVERTWCSTTTMAPARASFALLCGARRARGQRPSRTAGFLSGGGRAGRTRCWRAAIKPRSLPGERRDRGLVVPMRAIPFRAVFVLGLGQAAFPRPAGRHELDIRATERRAGDVDRREQDLYMLLKTLLSARDQVVLSYVARDEITGDELPASSVLSELRAILSQGTLNDAGLARLFCDDRKARPPLRRYDDSPERRQVLPMAEGGRRQKSSGEGWHPSRR